MWFGGFFGWFFGGVAFFVVFCCLFVVVGYFFGLGVREAWGVGGVFGFWGSFGFCFVFYTSLPSTNTVTLL